uniref:Coiled-coil domain containing 87 n=1 Tax=Astyanax mexicanus TaxID=7994 RepID=W5LAR7_ASTMX
MTRRVVNRQSAARGTNWRMKSEHKDTLTNTNEIQTYFQDILGSLSLFDNTANNDMTKTGRVQEESTESSSFKEIISVPSSLTEFCQQLRNRIAQHSLNNISPEDQETLASVMMAELSLIWQDLRGLPPDPLLTSEENKELSSHTYTKVLCICEELYLHYFQQLKMLEGRTVFSHHVNRSCLAANMAVDLSSVLNAHSIHCSVAMGIKAMRGDVKLRDGEQEEPPQIHTKAVPKRLEKICPHIKPKKSMESRQQSREQIGELDLEKVFDLMPFHQEPITSKVETHSGPATVPTKLEEDHCLFQSRVTRLKGCSSMPDLQRETLLEELEVASLPTRPLSPVTRLSADPCYSLNNEIDPAEHLKRLLLTDSIDESTMADFPLLVGALTSRGSSRLEELKNRLQRLEKKEELKEKKVKTQLETARPQHPQAAVESVSVSTLGIARMAAARVSDRVLHETININMYPPVYNDITEIEASSAALLDQNLFSGTELKDTYKVLSENLSSEYFNFDEDPMREPALSSAEELHGLKHKHLKKLMNPVDNYLNYISSQDSDDEEEDDENEKIKREQIRKQQEKIDALKRQKEAYQSGFWNANTVLMGGLWKEPVPDEAKETDEGVLHVGPEVPVAKSEEGEQIHARLERIWMILCLPEMQRLDMAIKYSTRAHRGEMEEAISAWEQAAQLIQQREYLLSHLEMFERVASDPSRFFQTGHHGSSAARMKEAKLREKLECQIAAVDKVLSKTVRHISETFNDTVTYKGRPYKEKMRWDRTEMLYWLQQERRVQALKKLVEGKGSLPARLPPLQTASDTC